ncbi:MAG: MoaD family protein [Dehalococcoidia bacterium]|jgi:adenylyltransferase/sulfurtransferase|nr:MoaD family protein [Dehalococcoidia bacterium]
MTVNVYIPTPFVKFTNGESSILIDQKNVGLVLKELTSEYGQLGQLIFDNEGALPEHINIYVNNQEINSLDGLETILEDGDQVAIIPAVSGGE